MRSRRIAVTQRVDAVADRDERRDALDQEWCRLLAEHGALPVLVPNVLADVVAFLEALAVDGVILTGGNDLPGLQGASADAPERDACERAVLGWCSERQIPLVGVCRGMQLLVQEYGGQLDPISNHVGVMHPLVVTSAALPEIQERTVNSFHAFGSVASDVGPELEVLAYAPDGVVEMVRHRQRPQWGMMWHPERAPQDARDWQLIERLLELTPCTT